MDYETVKVTMQELNRLGCSYGPLLWNLKFKKMIWYDNNGNFKVLVNGPLDFKLYNAVKRKYGRRDLNQLELYMREQLLKVEVPIEKEELSVYFNAFMKYRKDSLESFFTVDKFSGRIHTPIVNLKKEQRKHILIDGKETVSLDVRQSQPAILAKILSDRLGKNDLTERVKNGEDVYDIIINSIETITNREEAKKYFFKLIFGYPDNNRNECPNWMNWINEYKKIKEMKNPHWMLPHTNLAWLLQTEEVKIMTEVWTELKENKVAFLTIHDDIIVSKDNYRFTKEVMETIFSKRNEFLKLKISNLE